MNEFLLVPASQGSRDAFRFPLKGTVSGDFQSRGFSAKQISPIPMKRIQERLKILSNFWQDIKIQNGFQVYVYIMEESIRKIRKIFNIQIKFK